MDFHCCWPLAFFFHQIWRSGRQSSRSRFCFLTFSGTSHVKPISEIIFGRWFVRNCIETRCFRWSCHEQVKKTLRRSATKFTKHRKKQQVRAIWNNLPDPADPPDQVSSTAARTPLPHAPEARMTVVETNFLQTKTKTENPPTLLLGAGGQKFYVRKNVGRRGVATQPAIEIYNLSRALWP